jgi:hypothetical protein
VTSSMLGLNHLQCSATTLKMKPKLKNKMTIGSTFNPGLSSVYNLSMVPELPPAPADRVLDGRAFLIDSLWSAAARRRIADRGPPGGDPARAIEEVVLEVEGVPDSGPDSGPEVNGEAGLGEDCRKRLVHREYSEYLFGFGG